jgi:3-deoxy-manno-octulosonate cytidylyltransferase (CMP-KDO synthetase)
MKAADIITLAKKISAGQSVDDPNIVKVACGGRYQSDVFKALNFSRAPIPYGGPYFEHVGVYGYSMKILCEIVQYPMPEYAKSENLEQLAWMDAGKVIGVAIRELGELISINTPEDLEQFRQYLDNLPPTYTYHGTN